MKLPLFIRNTLMVPRFLRDITINDKLMYRMIVKINSQSRFNIIHHDLNQPMIERFDNILHTSGI